MIDAIFASRELQHKIDEIATAHSYGGQKEKLIEEMAELMVAIKHEDKPDVLPQVKRMEFHSELADVLILIWQILDIYSRGRKAPDFSQGIQGRSCTAR